MVSIQYRAVVTAHVAQSAEHILGKDEVTGSIPVMGFERQLKLTAGRLLVNCIVQ